jgi:hypothetical protein
MDEVCIFNRPLSSSEIQDLMTQGIPDTIPEINSISFTIFSLSFIIILVLVQAVKKQKNFSKNFSK